MESSTNPKATQQHELPKTTDTQVSTEIWQDLLHTAIVGNGIFPQSFFPQGLLLADKMADLVNQGKTSLDSLQKENPSRELISSMFTEAKNKSHSAYGFESSHSMMGGSIENVWGSDKGQALDILTGFSGVVYRTSPDVSGQSNRDETNLQEVISNPQEFSLLLELLGVARDTLLSQGVKEKSGGYKKEISRFMQKYSKHGFSNIPEEYQEEREGLMAKLYTTIKEATAYIKGELVTYAERQHPQNTILLERLKGSYSYDDNLFGLLRVANIHPLRNPDYE
jgi:hypothetical protein